MSYDVSLYQSDGSVAQVDRHEAEGGTYVVGGTTDADLNITYNYSDVYELVGWSVNNLKERPAGDTIAEMERVLALLGVKRYPDYWAATPGNAGHAVSILLEWAKRHPQAIWRVS